LRKIISKIQKKNNNKVEKFEIEKILKKEDIYHNFDSYNIFNNFNFKQSHGNKKISNFYNRFAQNKKLSNIYIIDNSRNLSIYNKTQIISKNINNTLQNENTSQIENKTLTNITYNSYNKTITENVFINFTLSHNQIQEDLNDDILNSSMKIKKIELPILENYIDVSIPNNLNLTTLNLYISNFLENTKIYIKTPNVVEVAKKHFNCKDLDSVELEHHGGLGSAYSHWSKKILNTEFMIADSYGENFISNFTLALFEDSGWYKVDYSKSEDIFWGKNQGCKFLNEKCVTKKLDKNNFFLKNKKNNNNDFNNSNIINNSIRNLIPETNFKREFCLSNQEEICSISKIFRGFCGIKRFEKLSTPEEFRYFDDPNISGLSEFGDYCPYPVEWTDSKSYMPIGSCRNGLKLRGEYDEKICENCRCFESTLIIDKNYEEKKEKILGYMNLIEKEKNFTVKNLMRNFYEKSLNNLDSKMAICYDSKCRNENGRIYLYVTIGSLEIKCPRKGGVLSIDGYKGYITCPYADDICVGNLNPRKVYSNTSSYNLFENLIQNLLGIIYDFIGKLYVYKNK
jgi:hypothetical protein